METLDSGAIHLELKYCERCGGLWLRLRGSDVVFCPTCAMALAGIARDPRFLGKAVPRREPLQHTMNSGSWSEGGNA